MKKLFLFALMTALTVSFTACQTTNGGGNGDDTPVELPACDQHDVDVVAKTLCGNYFDDLVGMGTYNYNIGLSTETGHEIFDIVSGMIDIREDHPFYNLDLWASEASAELNIKFAIPVGTYTFDAEDTCEAGTISAGYTTMIKLNGETYEYEYTDFVSGQVVVTADLIEVTLTDTEGKVHHVRYAGNKIDNTGKFGSWKDEGEFSTLTEDVTLVSEEWVAMTECYGDYYVIGRDVWDVLYSDLVSNSQFYLSVLTPVGAEKLSGEFPVSLDLSKSQMVLPGLVSSNEASWSWYEIYDSNDDWVGGAPLVSGKMVVSDNADGTQHVVLDFKDDLGHSVKAELDTEAVGASPWAVRSGVKISKRHNSKLLPYAKAKLRVVKR